MRDFSFSAPSRAKSWLRHAAQTDSDLNDVYVLLTTQGACLVCTDWARLHLDWRPAVSDHHDLPSRYTMAVQHLLRHIDGMQASVLLIDQEFDRAWNAFTRHEQRGTQQPFLYALPTPSFGDMPLPRLWVNGVHWLEALSGFQGTAHFWYHPTNLAQSPIAIGTPGVRLAMMMPSAF